MKLKSKKEVDKKNNFFDFIYCNSYLPLAKEEFPMVEDTKFCKYCNYKELCGRN